MIDVGSIKIRFDYDSPEIESISRCLRTLYSTREGKQPLDRAFGLNWDFIDKPLPVAQNEFAFEVMKKTSKYEPRAKVKAASFEYDSQSGNMIPVITLVKGDEI